MARTRLSSKGQIILPKKIRAAHSWKAGVEFFVEDVKDGVVLRPVRPFRETRLEELLGCTGYKGRKKTLRDMERAIATGARAHS